MVAKPKDKHDLQNAVEQAAVYILKLDGFWTMVKQSDGCKLCSFTANKKLAMAMSYK